MSVQAITWAYAQPDLTSAEKFVLVTLSNRADEDWSCYPSIELISRDTSLSEKTVRRALDDLETRGLLARERQRNPDGSLGRYRYFLKPPVNVTAGEKSQQSHGVVTMTGRKKAQQKQHAVTMTSGEKTPENHGPVTVTSGVTTVVPSGHGVPNPTGHHDRSTKPSVLSNRQKKDSPSSLRSEGAQPELFEKPPAETVSTSEPEPQPPEPVTSSELMKSIVFETGKRLLIAQGLSEQTARSFLGKQIKIAKLEIVARVISRAAIDPPVDARAWISAAVVSEAKRAGIRVTAEPADPVNWKSALREWVDYGTWPRVAGPTPDQRDYRGPIELLEPLLSEFEPGHPIARDLRNTIAARKRA